MAITPGSFAEVSKKISQIVARTWLDNEQAKQITTELESGDQERIKGILTRCGLNLDEFFSEMTVCVFVDCNTFESGGVNSTFQQTPNTGQVVIVNIPLPPRPNDVTLTDEVITGWIDGSTDPDRVYSSNQYIARITSS